MNIEDMPKYSTDNKDSLEQANYAGCYHCMEVCETNQITEYTTNNTAICPHCGVDALLPNVVDKELLKDGWNHWFNNA